MNALLDTLASIYLIGALLLAIALPAFVVGICLYFMWKEPPSGD